MGKDFFTKNGVISPNKDQFQINLTVRFCFWKTEGLNLTKK